MDLRRVTFSHAQALKLMGYPLEDMECYYYTDDGVLNYGLIDSEEKAYAAPYLELAAKWLRIVKNYHIVIDVLMLGDGAIKYIAKVYEGQIPIIHSIPWDNYEQALSYSIGETCNLYFKKYEI